MKKKAGIVILAVLFVALICGSFYYVKIKSNATADQKIQCTKNILNYPKICVFFLFCLIFPLGWFILKLISNLI